MLVAEGFRLKTQLNTLGHSPHDVTRHRACISCTKNEKYWPGTTVLRELKTHEVLSKTLTQEYHFHGNAMSKVRSPWFLKSKQRTSYRCGTLSLLTNTREDSHPIFTITWDQDGKHWFTVLCPPRYARALYSLALAWLLSLPISPGVFTLQLHGLPVL